MTARPAQPALLRAFEAEWAAVLASVARRFGDVELAEEATQDAFVTAAASWPRDGVPPNPGGWLTTTARRRAVDILRHERVRRSARAELAAMTARSGPVEPEEEARPDGPPVADDRLRLILMCCHPALALDARVALTLRLVGGLSANEIARAFLVEPAAMQQRLVRAKRKLRDAGIPFAVPGSNELPSRVDGLLAVLYLIFNAGWNAADGERIVRGDLCREAIRLARLAHALLPNDAEVQGLLALMLLHFSRAAGRQDAAGHAVALSSQDRSGWDAALIREGTGQLEQALRRRRPGRYQLQAAISALHAQAPSWGETDWPQIVALYGELARLAPSPVVELNRAIAVGMADGPHAGLVALEGVLTGGELDDYAPLHAAHAELLERDHERSAARAAWTRAANLTTNGPQRRALHARARLITGDSPGPAEEVSACAGPARAP